MEFFASRDFTARRIIFGIDGLSHSLKKVFISSSQQKAQRTYRIEFEDIQIKYRGLSEFTRSRNL